MRLFEACFIWRGDPVTCAVWLHVTQAMIVSGGNIAAAMVSARAPTAGKSSRMEHQAEGAGRAGEQAAGVAGVAPPRSLAARLALHALVFQNPRAVAALWMRSVLFTKKRHCSCASDIIQRTGRPSS